MSWFAQRGISQTSHGGLNERVHTPAAGSMETQARLPEAMKPAAKPQKVALPWRVTPSVENRATNRNLHG